MAAIEREDAHRFRVRFDELARGGLFGMKRRESVLVDPYLVGRAIAGVMRACTVRAATGRPLLWNDYRVILSRADFESLRPLSATLEHDLRTAMETEARSIGADMLGTLRLSVVVDEADELRGGEAVVRVGFVAPQGSSRDDELDRTMHADGPRAAEAQDMTIAVDDGPGTQAARFVLRWRGGSMMVAAGHVVILGRPHADAPHKFVPLHGASAKINKRQVMLVTTPAALTVGRLPDANPVHVNGTKLAAGAQVTVAPPVRVSLSNDELVVEITRG